MTAVVESPSVCPHPGGLPLTDRMLDLAMLSPGGSVLDVGCGEGATVAHLSDDRQLQAVGLDASAARIEAARRARPDLEFVTGRADGLPFADGTFEAVIAECVLSTLDQPGRAFAEMRRVLQPGGALLVSDLYSRTLGSSARTGTLPSLGTRERIEELFAGAGLEVNAWEDQTGALARLIWDLAGAVAPSPSTPKPQEPASAPQMPSAPQPLGRRIGYFICVARIASGCDVTTMGEGAPHG